MCDSQPAERPVTALTHTVKKNCLRLMRADIKGVEVVCDVVCQENGSSDRLGENSWLMCSHNRKYFNERERKERGFFFF